MDFFDELGQKFNDAADKFVSKTKEIAGVQGSSGLSGSDIARLKSRKKAAEKNITGYYCQLGKAYYENSGSNCDYIYSELVSAIDEETKNLLKIVEELDCASGIKVCRECKAKVSADSIFCNICGAKFEQPAVKPEATVNQQLETTADDIQNIDEEAVEEAVNVEESEDLSTDEISEDLSTDEIIEETESDTAEVIPEAPSDTLNQRICSGCGQIVREGAVFCTNCGTKYE